MRQRIRNKRQQVKRPRQARYNPKERATKRRLARKPLIYRDKTWKRILYWILGVFLVLIVILKVLDAIRSANNFKDRLNREDEMIRKKGKA